MYDSPMRRRLAELAGIALVLCAQAHAQPVDDAVVRVGTWNLKRLGHGDKRLDLVAAVIERFDVVALEEVMTPEGVDDLLAKLPGWKAAVSERAVGSADYAEYYAVVYRESAVKLDRAFLTEDADDRFAREPFVTCFDAAKFDFCVVSIHVTYGKRVGPRDAEIRELGALVTSLRAGGDEKDWVIVGDFNRPGSARSWRALHDQGWVFAFGDGKTPTSLGKAKYGNPYDHILVDRSVTGEWLGEAARVDIVKDVCRRRFAWCAKHVSDHAPVVARFATAGPDDD